MKTRKIILKIIILFVTFLLVTPITYADKTYDYYPPGDPKTSNLKRVTEDDGDIYEYYNEDRTGEAWNHQGRIILAYENGSTIKTWDWDTFAAGNQVILEVYEGVYSASGSDPVWKDNPNWDAEHGSERRIRYVYDYDTGNSDWWKVDTAINGWVEREKEIYDVDGTKILAKFLRDEQGRLVKDIYTEYYDNDTPADISDDHEANTYLTYEYFTGGYYEF